MRASLLLGLLALIGSAAWLKAENRPSPIQREAVLQSLAAHGAEWKAKAQSVSPRLYFSAQEWPQVQKEIFALSDGRETLVTDFFARTDRILTDPLPSYLPPEQMIGKPDNGTTLFSAQEELWQRDVGNNIFALAVAARLKPDGPYRQKMHDLVMAALSFDTWGRSNNPRMGNNSDLVIGHVARGIAVAYDWHRDAFTAEELTRIRATVAERLPCVLGGLYGNAYWATGFEENHNQVSVLALGFCGLAFYNEIPEAPEWLAAARLNFQAVDKHMPADGSSVEGVSYWAYGISYILQFIEATRPVIDSADLYDGSFLKNAAAYRLMVATPGLVGNLIYGDSVPRGWTTPHAIIYRLAAQYGDSSASWFADHLPTQRGTADDLALTALWSRVAPKSGSAPQSLDGRLLANDLVTTRSGWKDSDYVLSVKGGFTNRNHSHLDAGALALAFGDEWLLVAPGYGHGGGDGNFWQFQGPRWTFFSNATESHATLLINGKNQRFDREARGTVTQFFSSPDWNWSTFDLTRAYEDVRALTRSVLHRRGDYILVFDAVTADQPVSAEWLAQLRNEPSQENNQTLLSKGEKGSLRVTILTPDSPLTPRHPTVPKVDVKLPTHHTYAAHGSGSQISFTALLQPVGQGKNTPALKTLVESVSSDGERLAITGQGWTDHLARAAEAKEFAFPVPASGSTDSGSTFSRLRAWLYSLRGKTPPATITGTLGIVRTTDTGWESFLALDATAIHLPGFSYQSSTPCDLAANKTADGWAVTGSRDVKAAIRVGPGQTMHFSVGEPSK